MVLPKIREILLTQYIGAIVVALLVVDAVSNAVALIGGTLTWMFTRRSTSVLMESYPGFDWGKVVIPPAAHAALFALAAYLLVRWLYLPSRSEASDGEADPDATQEGTGDDAK